MDKLEMTEEFAADWRGYGSRVSGSRTLILWPHVCKVTRDILADTVVDVGCGNGELSRKWIGYRARRVVGIDINEHLLRDACLGEQLGLEYVQCDVGRSKLPLEESFCNIAFTNCLAVHLSRDGMRFLAGEILRVLKPGGVLLFYVTHHKWALAHYSIESSDEIETTTVRRVGSRQLREFFRPSSWYTDLFAEIGFGSVTDEDLVIPTAVDGLEHRYKAESGKELFTCVTAKKP